MTRKILSILILLLVCALGWYLFIKKSDYIYRFEAKTTDATVFYSISNWEKTNDSIVTETIDSTLYNHITQNLKYLNKEYTLYWDINTENDSLAKVNLGVRAHENNVINRITAPFYESEFKKTSKKIAVSFISKLKTNLSTFKVSAIREEQSPNSICACVNAKTTPEGKAKHMMRNYNYIGAYVADNNIQPQGRPMVVINDFDKEKNTIDMDFCFPIKGVSSIPEHPEIFFRDIKSVPAIKAVFNGNYMYSQHAWFRIYNYAKSHDINLKNKIIEKFHNNPNFGGDALSWKSEIYIPIAQ
ncbi:GyrI-like domain-containing protein [Joostella sp.]|uniref:GyrI-like domain-containing protein n=1 Tax=Joostella sp. TaxID=2231138 RepID=UPI003A8D7754